jgi:hypothetical protein
MPKRGKQSRRQMTATEACDFLGISVKTLGFLHWKALNPDKVREDQQVGWMPEPVQGSKWTETGVYSREDIEELDQRLDASPQVVKKRKKV